MTREVSPLSIAVRPLTLLFLLPCFCASTTSAQLSSNDIARLTAQCCEAASFLCQPISATTDVERLIAVGKVIPSRLHVMPVDCSSATFLLITNSAQPIYSFRRSTKRGEKVNLTCRPPEAEAIRQYLCPGINVTEARINHTDGFTHYGWTRKENNILIENQNVGVVIEDDDGSCLEYFNSVIPGPLSVRVPDAFDVAEWTPKVKRYVEVHWMSLALTTFQINPSEYHAELTESAEHFVLTEEGLLVCRFPFEVQEIHPQADGIRLDFTQFWIDVDISKGKIIRPPG